jgi:hypothetical protein
MTTIKSYTDLEQSKKLAEFLPLESADMGYLWNGTSFCEYPVSNQTIFKRVENIPCWSLAALSAFILPSIIDNDGNNYKFYLSKDGLDRWVAYYKSDDVSIHICEESDNMIDVILEMVCWLKNEEYI